MVRSFPTIFSDNEQNLFRRSFPTMTRYFQRNLLRQWPSLFRQSFPTIVFDVGQIVSVNRFRQWSDRFRQSSPTPTKSLPAFSVNDTIVSDEFSVNGQVFSEKSSPSMANSFPTIFFDNGQTFPVNRFQQWPKILRQPFFPTMTQSSPTIFADSDQIVFRRSSPTMAN